jgi:glycosyltransferase involved in cell wall biosynthesis
LQTPLGVGLGAVAAAKKYHVPLVATNHSMSENLIDNLKLLAPFARQIDYILREYGSRFYANADYVTLPTVAAIRMLKPDSFAKPYGAISNGIDLKRFHSGAVPREFYERYNIPMNIPVVMYLGRLDSEKHVSILLRALQHLDTKLPYHAVVVGDGNDLAHLKEVAADLGLDQHVTFVGRIDEADKPMILRLGTIFVMPSPAELQSISTMEAMASGMPVVAVNAGALYELCVNDKNGYLFEIDDYEMMSRGIGRLLADPEMAKRMGDESLAIAQTHDLASTITQFEELYEKIVSEYQPKAKRSSLLGSRSR